MKANLWSCLRVLVLCVVLNSTWLPGIEAINRLTPVPVDLAFRLRSMDEMMSGNPGMVYHPAGSRCSGDATKGARELLKYVQANYVGRSGGIYNCRNVRGSSTKVSLHGKL